MPNNVLQFIKTIVAVVEKLLSTLDFTFNISVSYSNGNLTVSNMAAPNDVRSVNTMQPGHKYYFECRHDSSDNANVVFGPKYGIMDASASSASAGESWTIQNDGTIKHNGSGYSTSSANGAVGRTISVLVDLVDGTITWYYNGNYWARVTGIKIIPYKALFGSSTNVANGITVNFGGSAYMYPNLAA